MYLDLMDRYLVLSYRLTLLEIQKLAYFLQVAGQNLRLQYKAGYYGPYADNLNKVLEVLEGHFIRGYGDSQKPDQDIDLLPRAAEQARAFMVSEKVETQHLNRVGQLIEGFETPYGMELLSSAHWVAHNGDLRASSSDEAIAQIHAWSPRKKKMFKSKHIIKAWDHLTNLGWV